jgi:hypothetical protein
MSRILWPDLNRRLSGRSEKEGDMGRWTGIGSVVALVMVLVLATAGNALAHCDGLDEPVVNLARQALAKGKRNNPLRNSGGTVRMHVENPAAEGGQAWAG